MSTSILVVDDSELSLGQMEKYLRKTDYDADYAESASGALDKMEARHYDIVITDKNMPGLHSNTDEGGMELLKHLQGHYSDTEVIMMTGYATIETAIEAMRLGAFDYLVKPFTQEELLACIKRILDYRAFINHKNVISIYRDIHNEILDLLERQKHINDEESHMMLKALDRKIDSFFRVQKNWEKILIEQRDALARIAPLAEQLRTSFPEDDPAQAIIFKILEASDIRL